MPELVYFLCTVASSVCGILLFRSYRVNRARLVLWSTLCFAALTASNVILFADLVLYPDIDLSMARGVVALAGTSVLVYGLVWDAA